MAIIRPLRAWRYNPNLVYGINDLTSPLFDVATLKQIEKLRQNPVNSIHITLPTGKNPGLTARKTLEGWKKDKVILQDEEPAIYVYYQYFSLPNETIVHCRRGIIAMVKYPEVGAVGNDKILIHEATIEAAVENRKELLREMELCASPTHGLYSDPSYTLEPIMEASMEKPLYDVTDYQGVRDVISEVKKADDIRTIVRLIAQKQIALADGHHRYQAGLDHRDEQDKPSEASKYHLIYLTNSHSDDFRILPTHRLIRDMILSKEEFIDRASEYFEIKEVLNASDLNQIIVGKKWAFGILLANSAYLLLLKSDKFNLVNSDMHDAIRELDVVIAHSFIIEKILGLPVPAKLTSDQVNYESNFSECITKVDHSMAQMAIIINEISPEVVFNVGQKGAIMPQKTTFFYPKVVGGYLFGTIREDEFDATLYSGL